MSSRKKTPDVLSEVLGAVSLPSSAPRPVAAGQKSLPTVGKPRAASASRAKKARARKSAVWLYCAVTIRNYRGWRPRSVDGVEIDGWKEGPLFFEYLAQMGQEGWEMTGIVSSGRSERDVFFKRPA